MKQHHNRSNMCIMMWILWTILLLGAESNTTVTYSTQNMTTQSQDFNATIMSSAKIIVTAMSQTSATTINSTTTTTTTNPPSTSVPNITGTTGAPNVTQPVTNTSAQSTTTPRTEEPTTSQHSTSQTTNNDTTPTIPRSTNTHHSTIITSPASTQTTHTTNGIPTSSVTNSTVEASTNSPPVPKNTTTVLVTSISSTVLVTNKTTILETTKIIHTSPGSQETTTNITSKSSTADTAPVTESINSLPHTSKTPHTTTTAPQAKTTNLTWSGTPNKNGDRFEVACSRLLESIGITGRCNMVGHSTNGDVKYSYILLTAIEPPVQNNNSANATSGEMQTDDTQMTSIAILASCGALALILIVFAIYCSCHRLSYKKNQQQLTEEMQTVENGYHDNPTLEVMEVQPEMQDKKAALNGEFNDSWIVPFDNLIKDDFPDEEDTHL